ncbi:MAG: vitamin B12 dependent-methionine synthase activation domain-containing protein [Dehalococcoidia bacterium]
MKGRLGNMSVSDDKAGIDIKIDKEQVCYYIGYDENYKLSARISSLIDDYAKHAHHLIYPLYSYVIKDVEWARGPIAFLEGSIIFKSQVVVNLLEQCQQAAIFVVTIGKYLEETAWKLARDGLILQATVLDAIGSNAVEKVAEHAEEKIRAIADSRGLAISRRFSPGYCDWNIGQQRMLFSALTGNTVGVRLTGECLMMPQKSISGIIGIGPRDSKIEDYNPCRFCTKQDCPGRRECQA